MLSDPGTLLLTKTSYMQNVDNAARRAGFDALPQYNAGSLVNKNNNNYYFLLTNEKNGYIVISVTIPDLF